MRPNVIVWPIGKKRLQPNLDPLVSVSSAEEPLDEPMDGFQTIWSDEWVTVTYLWLQWVLMDPMGPNITWRPLVKTSPPDASLSALSAKESLVETKDYKPMHLMDECLILTNKNHFLVMNPMGPKVISKTLV
jgi:hypothetical protein